MNLVRMAAQNKASFTIAGLCASLQAAWLRFAKVLSADKRCCQVWVNFLQTLKVSCQFFDVFS